MTSFLYCPYCACQLIRLSCPACEYTFWNNPKPTVSAIIVLDGQILLTKRAAKPYKNQWDLPGGFLQGGEHPEKGLKREMNEELGVEIKIKKLSGIYMDKYLHKGGGHTLNIYYQADIKKEKLSPQDDIKEARFFNLNGKLPRLAFKNGRKALKDFLNGIKTKSQT